MTCNCKEQLIIYLYIQQALAFIFQQKINAVQTMYVICQNIPILKVMKWYSNLNMSFLVQAAGPKNESGRRRYLKKTKMLQITTEWLPENKEKN
jgi:hypothetical protein